MAGRNDKKRNRKITSQKPSKGNAGRNSTAKGEKATKKAGTSKPGTAVAKRDSTAVSKRPGTAVATSAPKPVSKPSVSSSAGPRPGGGYGGGYTINGDPKLGAPSSPKMIGGPGPMKDITPSKTQVGMPRSSAVEAVGSGTVAKAAGSLLGRVLGGAVVGALWPTKMGNGEKEKVNSNPPSRPINPTPTKKSTPASPVKSSPGLTDDDVLNRLSASGVSQKTITKADNMAPLRELEKNLRSGGYRASQSHEMFKK